MSSERDEQIVQLIGGSQRSLLMYLLGLLGSQDLAEEALQNTNVVLWRKRQEYQLNTKFIAWACRIARLEACNLRKQRKRKVPVFSDVFIGEVAGELAAAVETPNLLEMFLRECVDQLNRQDQELLNRRYADGASTRSVADELKQSARSVYRNLERIHERLFDCVSEKARGDDIAL